MRDAVQQYLRRLPKVELHNHLEGGSMYPELALELAGRNGIQLPFADPESAEAYYRFTSLDQFIEILRTVVSTLNTAEDYARAVERQGELAAAQNIQYHELFVTYGLVSRRGVAWEAIVEGLEEGRHRNHQRFGVETVFIADLDRTLPEEEALRHVELAHRDRQRAGIIGIGLDCQERGYSIKRLAACFERARQHGFRLTAHAGEDGGAKSVWEALACGVERIDHGVQAASDPALVRHLAEIGVPLTVCPVSNVALRVFPRMEAHSFGELHRAGVVLTVNSDDPPMFATDMVGDLVAVGETFGLSVDELTQIVRNGYEASFQPETRKRTALHRFDAEVLRLRAEFKV